MAPKQHFFLTGANGYIGQHILSELLTAGHAVRAVVRSQPKVAQLSTTFGAYVASSQLDFGIVADLTAPGAFDAALECDSPFTTVIHTASPFNYRQASSNADFLDPAIKGTTELLAGLGRVAAARAVSRVVLTTSLAAVVDWTAPKVTHPPRVYTGADWNPMALEEAFDTANPSVAYQASKTFAEKALWDYVAIEGGGGGPRKLEVATVAPPMVYGPLFDASQVARPEDLGQSTWMIYSSLLRPGLRSDDPMPPTLIHLYADVRDVARAHLLAATVPAAAGRRFLVSAGEMSTQRMANYLREALPEKRASIPVGEPENWRVEEGTSMASSEEAEKVLGLTFRSAEDTIKDLGVQLVEIEKKAARS